MASTNSHTQRPDISDGPRLLTRSELESLKQDMKEASAWARNELKRRRVLKEKTGQK